MDNHDLENDLRERYARSYGYEPSGNWILIVHADDTTEFYRFEDPADMWCCTNKDAIGAMIAEEVRARATHTSEAKQAESSRAR